MRDILRDAIKVFGEAHQYRQANEEASEFAVACNHILRCREGAWDEMVGETADMEIMCEQMRILLGDEYIDEAKRRKLTRLAMRVEERRMRNEGHRH